MNKKKKVSEKSMEKRKGCVHHIHLTYSISFPITIRIHLKKVLTKIYSTKYTVLFTPTHTEASKKIRSSKKSLLNYRTIAIRQDHQLNDMTRNKR